MKKLSLLLLIPFILALVSCGGGGGSNNPQIIEEVTPVLVSDTNFVSLLDNKTPLEFSIPQNWSSVFLPEAGDISEDLLYAFIAPIDDPTDNFKESLFLFSTDVQQLEQDDELKEISVISTKPITISGISATETIFDAKFPELEETIRFLANELTIYNKTYTFIYAANITKFNKYIDISKYVFSTLRVGNIINNLNYTSSGDYPTRPAIATDGNNYLTITCKKEISSSLVNLSASFLSSDASVLKQFNVSPSYNGGFDSFGCDKQRHSVLFDDNQYIIAYTMSGNGNRGIYANRISQNGELLDLEPIVIKKDSSVNSNLAVNLSVQPSVSISSDYYLITWVEAGEIKGSLLLKNGEIIKEFTLTDQIGQVSYLASTYDGSNFTVVWTENSKIKAVEVSGVGEVLNQTPIEIMPNDFEEAIDSIEITFVNNQLVLTWGTDSNFIAKYKRYELLSFSTIQTFLTASPVFDNKMLWNTDTQQYIGTYTRPVLDISNDDELNIYYYIKNDSQSNETGLRKMTYKDNFLSNSTKVTHIRNYNGSRSGQQGVFNLSIGTNNSILLYPSWSSESKSVIGWTVPELKRSN